jgi:hypothetical protein
MGEMLWGLLAHASKRAARMPSRGSIDAAVVTLRDGRCPMPVMTSGAFSGGARLGDKMAIVRSRLKIACLCMALAVANPIRRASATTGGPTELRILGWSKAQFSVLIAFNPGGENEEVDLLAFNPKKQLLERAICDSCASTHLGDDPRDLTVEQKDYLKVLKGATKLQKLKEISREDRADTGLTFRCQPPTRQQCQDEQICYHHTCVFGVGKRTQEKVEFSARSTWFKSRLFAVPSVPDVGMAWVVRTGLVEFGYREDEVFFAPKPKHKTIPWQSFVAKYFPKQR